MTVIGKILTFMVFFFSLVFLGFAVQINRINKDPVSKKSWYEVAKEREKNDAKRDNDIADNKRLVIQREAEDKARYDKVVAENKRLTDENKTLEARAISAETVRDQVKNAFGKDQVAATDAEEEVKKRRLENQQLVAERNALTLAMAKIAGEKTKAENERIRAVVELASVQDRAKALERDLQQTTRALETLREQRDTQVTTTSPAASGAVSHNPPPENVEGIIQEVRPAEGLVQISLGSDDGIGRGHTLEVFRLDPKPKYLGVIRIVEVQEKQAVGRLLSPQFNKIVQPNDIVASKIVPRR